MSFLNLMINSIFVIFVKYNPLLFKIFFMSYKLNKIIKEPYIFYALLLLQIVYVFSMPVFLTQDGPSHLYNSKILLDIFTGNNTEIYNQYYNINIGIIPNWFSNVFLSILLFIFSPIFAEKVFISLLIISLPLSFRYAIKAINPKALYLSMLVFIFANSYFLMYGFFNFQWSLSFLFLFIGLLFKNDFSTSIKCTIKLSLLSILVFFTHPVAYILVLLIVSVFVLQNIFQLRFLQKSEKSVIFKNILHYFLIVLPSLILFLIYFLNHDKSDVKLFINKLNYENIKTLFTLNHLKVFANIEGVFFKIFTLLLMVNITFLILKKFKEIKIKTLINLSIIVFFCLFIYFFISDVLLGGAYLGIRITVFIYLLLILIAAHQKVNKTVKIVTIIGSLIISISILVIRFPIQNEIGKIAKEYIEVNDLIPNNVTVLPLGFSNRGEINSKILSPNINIFRHISGYIGASKQRIIFDNYEANTQYFPLLWKKEVNPYLNISSQNQEGIELNPPKVDVLSYNKKEICKIDYIIVWGDKSRFNNSEDIINLNKQLTEDYKLIYTSTNSLTMLYKRILM